MEHLTSRKSAYIRHVRLLASDGEYRRESGQFLCEGMKTLRDALAVGAEIVSVLWKGEPQSAPLPSGCAQYAAPAELFDYAAPLVNCPGPLFAVRIAGAEEPAALLNAIVLESVQDPGNVGTVIRTANALGMDAVILCGDCADLYHPKTVRATMGAVFRQRVLGVDTARLGAFLKERGLTLYGAALSDKARDLRTLSLKNAAVAIGSEGRGLSAALLAQCEGEIIIPMRPESESLNAAVAAAIAMWEIVR